MTKPDNKKILEKIKSLLIEPLRDRINNEERLRKKPRLRENGPTIKGDKLTFYVDSRDDPKKHNLSIGRSKNEFVLERIKKVLATKDLECKQGWKKMEARVYKKKPCVSHFSCEEIAEIINALEEEFNAYS